MPTDQDKHTYPGFEPRLQLVAAVLSVAFFVLAARLWDLQVHRGSEFRGKSDTNRLRIQTLESPRGVIIGRRGNESVVLADNRPARDLVFVPADCTIEPEIVCERLERIVGIPADVLLETIKQAQEDREPHRQILLRQDIPASVSARLDEYVYALPGVFTIVRPIRRYVYGKTGGQILGYLGEISKNELATYGDQYGMGDLIGRAGLERLHEANLHGTEGRMLMTRYAAGVPQLRTDPYGNPYVENLVDSRGHSLRIEEEIQQPVPGRELYVTLDVGLQGKAEELLEGEEGAIVVLNATTGEVLALASNPGYDPGIFVTHTGNRERSEVLTGKPNRMIHRAFQEVYAPGSIYKILLAVAALEEGVINSSTTHYCDGKFRLNQEERPWHCWKRSGHREVGVVDALAFSCDVFFYNVGMELGVDKIHEWSRRMGMGKRTGLDLPGEVSGLIPSRKWKEDRLKPLHPNEPWEYRWYPGETVNLSIGQGDANATPLQNAVLMAAIVNGGHRVQPYLNQISGLNISDPLLSESTLKLIQRGLRKCIEKGPPAPTGTGQAAMIEGYDIIGKTGSAQNVSLSKHEMYETEEDIPKEIRDHAWFVAGVMDRKPNLAICILVEHGHHGSSAAAPLAKDLINYYYDSLESEALQVAAGGGGTP